MENMSNNKTAIGLDGNITAVIGYLIPIVALIEFFIEKNNKFARYHALQSVLWAVVFSVGIIAFIIIGLIFGFVLSAASGSLATVFWILMILVCIGLSLIHLAGVIFVAIKAFGGNTLKLPVIGGLAEKWSN